MRNLKNKALSVALSAMLSSCAFAPAALANDEVSATASRIRADLVATQAANTVQAYAEEVSLGGSANGVFELDESGKYCNECWYKFKTTDEVAGYRVKLEMLSPDSIYFSLYDQYGTRLQRLSANPTMTITKTGLDKDTWYYILVGDYYNVNPNKKFQGDAFSVSVEKFDIDVANSLVTLDAESFIYDGKSKKPNVSVELDGSTLKNGTDYSVSYANNIEPGTATVTIAGKGNYIGSKTVDFAIGKTVNTMKASANKVTVKSGAKKLKKSVSVSQATAFSVSDAKGSVKFTKRSGNAKIAVSKAGKVTMKKGLKNGTYKVKVDVRAAGDTRHAPLTKTLTLTVKLVK
ncbi:MAG: hypothetical protein IJ087_13730 [Eggerthellaceae bacterium]|nr:hypothetical protein [Eggerthellaceae bacterium]